MRLAVKHIAEAIGSNDGTTVQNHPLTQGNVFIKGYIGIQYASPADYTVIPHKDERINGDFFGDPGTLTDMSQRRDPLRYGRPRVEQTQEASQGNLRSFHLK